MCHGSGKVATAQDHLRQVADVYRANFQYDPTLAVQEEFGLSQRTAARRVQQARAAGFLGPTTKGRKAL